MWKNIQPIFHLVALGISAASFLETFGCRQSFRTDINACGCH